MDAGRLRGRRLVHAARRRYLREDRRRVGGRAQLVLPTRRARGGTVSVVGVYGPPYNLVELRDRDEQVPDDPHRAVQRPPLPMPTSSTTSGPAASTRRPHHAPPYPLEKASEAYHTFAQSGTGASSRSCCPTAAPFTEKRGTRCTIRRGTRRPHGAGARPVGVDLDPARPGVPRMTPRAVPHASRRSGERRATVLMHRRRTRRSRRYSGRRCRRGLLGSRTQGRVPQPDHHMSHWTLLLLADRVDL